MSSCEDCGSPLSEFESCSYGDLCMFCYDREQSPCNGCQEEECYGCPHEEVEKNQ